ncbi:alkaline phosphatase family protein [Patescibacteria group bacterium]|nr:alkaline phosphatase family protein [Patescibacteria group bacterium]MBU1613453.1 alkaline phosphatase family protein [Patescibacteria group bacterium]
MKLDSENINETNINPIIKTIKDIGKSVETKRATAFFGLSAFLIIIFGTITMSLTKPPAPHPKFLLLGIDAATWDIINPLLDAGRMPNLQKLIDEGVSATMKTQNPTISPAIWTTIATGKLPSKHGIRSFLSTSETYEAQFSNSEDRTTKALWNILSERGEKIGLFSYWATWPPEKINGYTVTDMALIDEKNGVYPDYLRAGIIANSIKTLGINPFTDGFQIVFPVPTDIEDDNFFSKSADILTKLNKLFISNSIYAFNKERPTIMMQIDGSVDASQHLFLKFLWPEKYPTPVSPVLVGKYGDMINKLYIDQDKMIGEYIERSGPNTNIIVMSDHGVFLDPATGYRFAGFNPLLSQLGFLSYYEGGKINYENTRVFECNNNSFDWQRRLCINLKGKYTYGVVPQTNYEQTRNAVIQALRNIKTTSGQPLFNSIILATGSNSDIECDINRNIFDEDLIINGTHTAMKDYLNLSIESGNHYSNPTGPDGIFVWKGPNIKKGEYVDIRYEDITPNILHNLGLPIGRDMDGKFLPELYINPTEPKYIDTYEDDATRISLHSMEATEDDDDFSIDGNEATIHSVNATSDEYDSFCIFAPNEDAVAVQINDFENSKKTDKNVALQWQYTLLKNLPRLNINVINLDTLLINQGDGAKYKLVLPLEKNKEPSLEISEKFAFGLSAPSDGILRLIAKSAPASGAWPELNIMSGTASSTFKVNSTALKSYDVPVSVGRVNVTLANDTNKNRGEAELYIQNILFSPGEFITAETPIFFYRQNGVTCVKNSLLGITDLSFSFSEITKKTDEQAGQSALDLLQNTGEIKKED